MPFPIRVPQVDGGSEFAAEFEQAYQQQGLHLIATFIFKTRYASEYHKSW